MSLINITFHPHRTLKLNRCSRCFILDAGPNDPEGQSWIRHKSNRNSSSRTRLRYCSGLWNLCRTIVVVVGEEFGCYAMIHEFKVCSCIATAPPALMPLWTSSNWKWVRGRGGDAGGGHLGNHQPAKVRLATDQVKGCDPILSSPLKSSSPPSTAGCAWLIPFMQFNVKFGRNFCNCFSIV